MDLEHLNRFITLASMKPINFSHAAEMLNIPQPYLSQQIKRLEQELGVELFNRKQRPAALTPAGHEFLKEIRHIHSQLDRAKVSAQRAHRGEIGQLRVGINISISNSKFPELFLVFRGGFPSVEITLHEMISRDQIEQLQNQQLDVGFFHSYELDDFDCKEDFETLLFLEESLMIVLPERHPLAQQSQVKIVDLKDEQFILPSATIRGLRQQIIALCQEAGFFPKIKQEATWMTTSLSLVACEVGVTILPANVQNLQRMGVAYRPIQGESPMLKLLAVWQRDYATATLQNFLMVLQRFALHSNG